MSRLVPVAAIFACVTGVVVMGGFGVASRRAARAYLSVGAAAEDPGFVACMRRYGMSIRSDGELQATKVVGPAQLDGAERTCGFGSPGPARAGESAAEARGERSFAKSVEHTPAFRRALARVAACLRANGVTMDSARPGSPQTQSSARNRRALAAAHKCRAALAGESSRL